MSDRYLVISDLQIPFEASQALRFCQSVVKEFKIPKTNICCVGDEVDQYFGSLYKKSADGLYTATQELKESTERLKAWYREYPEMKLCTSNHGMRWARKASEAEIPSQMIRAYQEIIAAPKGWQWRDSWVIRGKHRAFKMIHGLGYSGMYAYRQAPLDMGMNTVFGHLHSNAGIAHINTAGQKLWGMNVGSLIDTEAYAFAYNRDHRIKPWLGVGIILDGGLTPQLIPYERFCA